MLAEGNMFEALESSLELSLAWFVIDPGLAPEQADNSFFDRDSVLFT